MAREKNEELQAPLPVGIEPGQPTLEIQNGPDPVSELVREELEKLLADEPPANRNGNPRKNVSAPPPVNLAEQVVNSMARGFMEELGICTCERCTSDVAAIALNELRPQHVVANEEELLVKLAAYEKKHEVDIKVALERACIQVSATPRH